jgi:drug/metabolite transporter (DMT)-like permease
LSAIGINLTKNCLGSLILISHLILLAAAFDQPVLSAPARSWGWLSLSGLVGIGLGDTCYFRSLQILGPRRSLIIASTGPLFAALLAWVMLGETLTYAAFSGIVMTVAGVVIVVADRKALSEAPGIMPGAFSAGVILGTLGAVCQVIGGICSKHAMTRQVDGQFVTDCSPVEATFIRLFVSAMATVLVVFAMGKLGDTGRNVFRWPALKLLVPATAIGTWLGIWFSQIAFKETPNVAIAQTLHSTCPLFAIPIVWIVYRQQSSWYSILGTVVAIAGIYLVCR